MLQIQQQISEYKSNIETSFRDSMKQIKTLYCEKITKLERTINDRDSQIAKLQSQLKCSTSELTYLKSKNTDLMLKQQNYREQIENLKISMKKADFLSQNELSLKLSTIEQLKSEINLLQKQNQKLINQQEVFSSSFSTMSKQQYPSFSVEISEYFKNTPEQILKFLDSIPGQLANDLKEEGDMTCMFVSKDGLSLQKFVKINRTFLKRTIKEHQKRFRFVLIHKPDKKA